MRRWYPLLVILAMSAVERPMFAAITPEQKKELAAIRSDLNKIPSLIGRKKLDDARKSLDEAEQRLDSYVKAEEISDKEPVLKGLRVLLEKQKSALLKAGGKPHVEVVSFVDQVAPIIAEKCLGCHGEDAKGGLRLDSFAGLERGGQNGPLWGPDGSLLLARLTTPNPQERMPKEAEALPQEEIKTITAWIVSGAKFDGTDKSSNLGKLEKPKEAIQVAKPTGGERVSFIKDVAPGFVVSCQRCHNANNRSGGFSMVTFEKLMQGGDSGKVITPGKLDESKLWKLIEDGDMPRQQGRITRTWYNNLKIWIEEGCKYDAPDPRVELVRLIPTEEEMKLAELAKLTPEQFAARRLEVSDEQWRKTFPKVEPAKADTSELILLGDVSETRLKMIARWADGQLQSLRTLFQAKEEPLFRGKLTVFVFKDRFGYEEFNSTIHQRDVPREVVGHSQVSPITQEEAFIALQDVGDDPSETSPGMELNLMEQLAGAFLKRQAKKPLPDWLVRGTGLALAARGDLAADYLTAQRHAVGTILQNARLERPEQIFESGTFSPSDVGPIGLTLVEFLLKQGGNHTFGQLVQRIQAGEDANAVIKAVYQTDAKLLGAAYASSHSVTGSGKKKSKK